MRAESGKTGQVVGPGGEPPQTRGQHRQQRHRNLGALFEQVQE